MWQIQWVLGLIPDGGLVWLYTTAMCVGVALYIGSKIAGRFPFKLIPVIGQYPFICEWLGVILMVSSVFLYGGYATEMSWRAKVADLEAQIKVAEAKSQETNVVIQTKYRDKVKIVKDVQLVIQERIKEVEKRIDAECKVAPEAIEILNDSAKNQKGKK